MVHGFLEDLGTLNFAFTYRLKKRNIVKFVTEIESKIRNHKIKNKMNYLLAHRRLHDQTKLPYLFVHPSSAPLLHFVFLKCQEKNVIIINIVNFNLIFTYLQHVDINGKIFQNYVPSLNLFALEPHFPYPFCTSLSVDF